jgi:hypothetical protein
MYIKNSSGWKQISEMYIKIASGWKQISEGYIKTSAGWKRFWSGGTLSPQFPVIISQSTNATTYLITLTGTNYYWSPGPPGLTYYFEWSTNGGTSWTTLSTASAINPGYGSSTSYTHQITTSQLSANLVNTYRFRIAATYGSQSAIDFATTTVQGPTNITLTAGDTGVSSIPINWTSSTGAYRYLVEYKTNSSAIWLTYSWTGTTYETITGLAEGTLYNVRVTPYTSQSNSSTYKGYSGNASNTVNATTKVTPGNLSRVENYNFDGSMQQGFFTTGSNTTKVQYYFNCISIPSLSVPTYTQNTTSGIPYKIQQNLLSYFTIKNWNYDTYSASTTYFYNNTVWYAGNQYTANYVGSNTGFSGQAPTNTTYWTKTTTVTYNIGDYVLYNSVYYFCKTSTNGTYPTNTTFWLANSVSFQMYATPYNIDIPGTTSSAGSTLIIRGDTASTDPLRISSGPTFSNITTTAFRATFTPSVYTNQVDFYIQKVSDSSYPTGYNPKVINVSGATSTNHDTTTTLTASTQYFVTINSRYMYDSTYLVFHNGAGASAYVTTSAPLPDPPTGLNVSDVGTNRPYNNAAYDLSWTAPTYTGGIALTGYKIQYQVPSTGTTWYDYSANTVDTSSTSIRLTGFGSNLSTNFRVYSVNSAGQSLTAATTASPVLGTTVPQAPTIGTATTFNGYATVTYTANATGGKTITSFTANSSPSGYSGSTSSGSIFVYSLGHNVQYSFTVTSTNANGTSSSSASSNTIYGVNIGSVTVNSSTSTSSSITLFFTKATNSTNTRGYLSGSLDGTTAGTSYTFSGLASNTSYNLGLAGTDTVNGTLYIGPITTGSYSTSAPPAVTVNSYPSISGTGASGSTISFASGSYNNASTITKTLMVSTSTSFSTSSGSKGSVSPYTITTTDASPPAYYFAVLDTVVGTNGLTYYFWSGGYSGSSVTIPAGSGSILSYLQTYTVTWNANGGSPNLSSSGVMGATVTAPTGSQVTRSGFTLLYWRDTPSLDFTYSVNPGGSWTIDGNRTFYARWQSSGGTAPATPTGVSTSGSGLVTWNASTGATSYTVEYQLANNASGTLTLPAATATVTTTSYQITYQTVGGTTYNYARARVLATNANGSSAYSGYSPATGYV